MKKLLLLLLTLLFILFPFNTAWAATSEDVMQRIDEDITTSNSFIDYMEVDDGSTAESIIYRLGQYESHFNQSAEFYKRAANEESDADTKVSLQGLSENTESFSQNISEAKDAFNEGDSDKLDRAIDAYNDAVDSFNFNAAAMNDNYELVDYSWLSYPFWVSLIISVVLFIISRGKPILPAEVLRKQYEFGLFKDSLWALGGSVVSYVWYLATPVGGTFYVLWGPIVFGYLYFIKNLYTFVTVERPRINAAKREQVGKLQDVLQTDATKVSVPAIGSEANAPKKKQTKKQIIDTNDELVSWDSIKDKEVI